jgi:hypothetical protein
VETQTGILDLGESGFLVLLELGVFLLELFNFGAEELLSSGGLGITFGDLGVQVVVGQSLDLLDAGFLLIVAQVNVGGRARGLEGFGVLLEGSKVSAAFVGLEVGGVARFDGGETFNIVGIAEGFAAGGAVNIGNENGGVALEFFHELVPIRLHLLAVSSPRSKELNEDGLACDFGVPIGRGKFEGADSSHKGEEGGSDFHNSQ